jgi:S1-C subfamily serine protease
MVLVRTNVGYGSAAAAGTGMVVDSDGLVVTNHHVVEGATGIRVEVAATGRTYRATVLGTDATHDVALLRLAGAHGLATVATDSSAAAVGEKVTAIGDADGADSLTAADGRLTALRSSITVQDDQGADHRLSRLIQVDADVVPGDSGGAVLDGDGDVIAMTTAATSGSPQVSGYAIPIGRVLSIAGAIESGRGSGTVTIGYDGFLGVELADDTGTAAANPVVAGVVDGTAAASLGMAPGDTIVAVDGTSVSTAAQLHDAIASHRPGQRVSVSWTDPDGVTHEGAATLSRGPVA